MAGEALQSIGVALPSGVAQLFGPAAQLVDIRTLGNWIRHGVSLLSLRSAAQAEEEATATHSY